MKSVALLIAAALLAPVAAMAGDPIELTLILAPGEETFDIKTAVTPSPDKQPGTVNVTASLGGIKLGAQVYHVLNYTRGSLLLETTGADGVRRTLEQLRSEGKTLSRLTIATHGSPGATMLFGRDDLDKFKGLDDMFAPGAEVAFLACNVGEDVDFVRQVGRTFLARNGGEVRAPIGKVYGPTSEKGWVVLKTAPGQPEKLSYVPPMEQLVKDQLGNKTQQAYEAGVQFPIETAADIAMWQMKLADGASKLAARNGMPVTAKSIDRVTTVVGVTSALPALAVAQAVRDAKPVVVQGAQAAAPYVAPGLATAAKVAAPVVQKAVPVVQDAVNVAGASYQVVASQPTFAKKVQAYGVMSTMAPIYFLKKHLWGD